MSVSTVKRLIDAGELPAARTVGKHRLVSPEFVLRYALEKGFPIHDSFRGMEDISRQTAMGRLQADLSNDGTIADQLYAHLIHGHVDLIHQLVHGFLNSGYNSVQLSDDLIQPAMSRIGESWLSGDLDIFHEHRATRILEGLFLELNSRMRTQHRQSGTAAKPLCLGASPENDLYTLSGLLCELALRGEGWEVMNLGPNLPLKSLSAAVVENQPRLVWLTVTHLESPEQFIHEYNEFYSLASRLRVPVVLGGQGLTPPIRQAIRSSAFGERMSHLVEFARVVNPRASDFSNFLCSPQHSPLPANLNSFR